MKKIITVIVLVFAFAFTTQAQKKGGKPSTEKVLKKLTKELNLSTEQQNKIKPLLEAQMADRKMMNDKRKALKDSGEKPSKEERMQMRKDRTEAEATMNAKMASILDKEQFAKFEAMAKEKGRKGKEKKKKKN